MPCSNIPPFHLAYPVSDLKAASEFFEHVLGCRKGRASTHWVDFDFFGHQLSLHEGEPVLLEGNMGHVDKKPVPIPHFGVVLPWEAWQGLIERLEARGISFVLAPHVRFEGKPGEQGAFFIEAPGGIALEFKAFKNSQMLFSG